MPSVSETSSVSKLVVTQTAIVRVELTADTNRTINDTINDVQLACAASSCLDGTQCCTVTAIANDSSSTSTRRRLDTTEQVLSVTTELGSNDSLSTVPLSADVLAANNLSLAASQVTRIQAEVTVSDGGTSTEARAAVSEGGALSASNITSSLADGLGIADATQLSVEEIVAILPPLPPPLSPPPPPSVPSPPPPVPSPPPPVPSPPPPVPSPPPPSPKLGCGSTPPGVDSYTCESCPFAWIENVPAAAVGMTGDLVTVCTACDSNLVTEITAVSAPYLTPPVSCYAGVSLTPPPPTPPSPSPPTSSSCPPSPLPRPPPSPPSSADDDDIGSPVGGAMLVLAMLAATAALKRRTAVLKRRARNAENAATLSRPDGSPEVEQDRKGSSLAIAVLKEATATPSPTSAPPPAAARPQVAKLSDDSDTQDAAAGESTDALVAAQEALARGAAAREAEEEREPEMGKSGRRRRSNQRIHANQSKDSETFV